MRKGNLLMIPSMVNGISRDSGGRLGRLLAFSMSATALAAFLCAGSVEILLAQKDAKAEDLLRRVRSSLEKMKTLSGEFEQQFHWKLADETQVVTGKVFYKKDNHYRVETPSQDIVTDGKTLWTLSRTNNQVVIDKLSAENESLLPRELMLGYTSKYRPTLAGRETIRGTDCYKLLLLAKSEDEFTPQISLWVDKESLVVIRIEQVDLNENRNVYDLKAYVLNKSLDSDLFRMKPGSDVEIIDMR